MSIITFIIIISVLVFVHELGHFLAAKKSGIRVDEFAIGFPPRIFSFKKGETVYAINLIPFGGYVKIFGENPDEDSLNGPDSERSFVKKPRYIQAMVLVAGILCNIIFAWILFSTSFAVGITTEADSSTQGTSLFVAETIKDSPASNSGIMKGDKITSLSIISDSKISQKNIDAPIKEPLSADDVKKFIKGSDGKEVSIQIVREGKVLDLKVTPKKASEKDDFAIGIQMSSLFTLKLPIHKALWQGAKTTVNIFKETVLGLGTFFKNIFTAKANFSDVAGPVGIVSLVGQASQFGFGYLLSFTALISINLAVINLIPFPALDGGRIFFVLIESIRRKAISPKITNALNLAGFALLIIFMVVVTFSDIRRLLGK